MSKCKYCDEEPDDCDCLKHHIRAMEEVGFSYADAEEAFEWEGHRSRLGDWAEQCCDDCGYPISELPWFIANAIDWERVAESLLQDYHEVEYDNYIYLYRAC